VKPLVEMQHARLSVPTGHIFQKRKVILGDVSFSVQQGTSTAYLGTNGAGKTSTFRILCGLVKPDQGRVLFDGEPMSKGLPPKRFGFMPEHPYFYKNLTPQELLEGLGRLSGLQSHGLKKNIQVWAEKLDFEHVLKQRLATCSKGQVQRVGLAQALIHQPDFILLDEPLSGLDPLGRARVRQVIHEEMKRGATVLFSSHILSDAEAMCDQVVVLQQGEVTYSGEIHTLLAQQNRWLIKVRTASDVACLAESSTVFSRDGVQHIRGESLATRDAMIQRILSMRDATLMAVEFEQRTLEDAFMDLLQNRGASDASRD